MVQSHLADRVVTAEAQAQVLDRVRRWAASTDLRVVHRLWPAQPDGARHALCPSCGVVMRDGMLITLNHMTSTFSAGPAQRALATGDLGVLGPEMPIEPGELWCIVCLPCLEDQARMLHNLGLSDRLVTLVDEALADN